MSIKAMKQAIEAWEACGRYPDSTSDIERLDVAINALRTAIQQADAQQPATGEPDGWKLVPIVPTEKMLLAYTGGAITSAGFRWCRHQWSAMLAAAPAAHPPHRDCGCADCAPSLDEKLDSTRTALVNPKAYWLPITDKTPRGAKCFLINRPAKSATTGVVGTEEKFFTHYFPMPVFDPNEEESCQTTQPTNRSS